MDSPACHICHETNFRLLHSDEVYRAIAPKSHKTILDIIRHISRVIKVNFNVPARARVCNTCYKELVRYDFYVVELLNVQKRITEKISARVQGSKVQPQKTKPLIKAPSETADCQIVEKKEISENDITEDVKFDNEGIMQEDMEEDDDIDFDSQIVEHENAGEEYEGSDSDGRYQCSVCNVKFTTKKALAIHMDNDHKTRVSCNVCGAQVRNEEYLAVHMNIHNGKSETECSFCDKKFARRANVIRHMEVHFDKKKHQCERCGMFFSQSTVFLNHRLQHEAEDNPQICPICNQSFKTSKTFKRHMVTHQDDRPRYSCENCGKVFVDKYTLKVHKKAHHTEEEEKSPKKKIKTAEEPEQELLTCIICQHIFLGREFFNDHMQNVHDVVLDN